jgi:hypothetical protein
MSVPRRAAHIIAIPLTGYVTLQDVCVHVGDIWRQARDNRRVLFALRCATVIDFSNLALTALGRLRKHLREHGSDLVLVDCSSTVLSRKDDTLLAPLLKSELKEALEKEEDPATTRPFVRVPRKGRAKRRGKTVRREGLHGLQGPDHVQMLVKQYQRYWLN